MEPVIAPEMVAVIPRPAHTVRIVFADGEVRDVDITPLLDTPAFSPLREASVFDQVKVDEDTGTITWPGDVDLDPDVIYAAMNLGPNAAVIHVLAPASPPDGVDLKRPAVSSPVVVENVAVRVSFHVRRARRRGYVRLYGTVAPAEVGALVGFQLLRPTLAITRKHERAGIRGAG